MLIRLGYEMAYDTPQATPMILNLNAHYSRASDWVRADTIVTNPAVPFTMYRDGFGNWCTRLIAPTSRRAPRCWSWAPAPWACCARPSAACGEPPKSSSPTSTGHA